MVARNTIGLGLIAASVAFAVSDPLALAQQRLQTPDGRQTVAPSDMPQQPTLSEDFANPTKINERSGSPSVGVDMPGLPGIETPGRKPVQGPGTIMNAQPDPNDPVRMREAPADPRGTVETPRTGGIVLPQGVPSSVRIGPVYEVPMWQRAALGFWLALQLVVLMAVAVTMQIFKRRSEDEHQGGSIIDRQTTSAVGPNRHVPHTP